MPDSTPEESAWVLLYRRRPPWADSFLLHVITGFIATGAHYGVMYALLKTGLAALPATTIGFVAGAATRFLLSYFHVFEPTSGVRGAMVRFVVLLGMQMVVNSALVAALMAVGLHVWVAQVLTTGSMVIFTFVAGKLWVFR